MRFLIITYKTSPTGQISEEMTVTKKLRMNDIQTGSVILDFRKLEVVKASMGGQLVPKDWERIVSYYYEHYSATIERLFLENGWELKKVEEEKTAEDSEEPTAVVEDKDEVETQSA